MCRLLLGQGLSAGLNTSVEDLPPLLPCVFRLCLYVFGRVLRPEHNARVSLARATLAPGHICGWYDAGVRPTVFHSACADAHGLLY